MLLCVLPRSATPSTVDPGRSGLGGAPGYPPEAPEVCSGLRSKDISVAVERCGGDAHAVADPDVASGGEYAVSHCHTGGPDMSNSTVFVLCTYCGNRHTYSEEMCRDIHRAHTQAPAVPTPFGFVSERTCVERERAAYLAGREDVLNWGVNQLDRRYPMPEEK